MKTLRFKKPSNPLSKLIARIRTKVRYRLLFLISAPILITMLSLFVMTLYWTVNYTWSHTLNDVEEKLNVAGNSVDMLQRNQISYLRLFAHAYHFNRDPNLQVSDTSINNWIKRHYPDVDVDYIHWHSLKSAQDKIDFEQLSKKTAFFDILSETDLAEVSSTFQERARVTLQTGDVETRGMISRAIYPIKNKKQIIIGYLESGILLNNSNVIVDNIRDLIYPNKNSQSSTKGTVTIFLDDIRISTNVPTDIIGERAIGSMVSAVVKEKVLGDKENYLDYAFVYNDWYISAYEPLFDQHQNVVGMLYTGQEMWPLIKNHLINVVEMSLVIISILFITGILVFRNTRDLFHPIEKISTVVGQIREGNDDNRIGQLGLVQEHELSILANQFDLMLDLLSEKKQEILNAAHQLEGKVISRTAKLQEKTEQLELHIDLLHKTRDKLVTSDKLAALGRLTAGIAHEINNPIAVILGNVELMKMDLQENDLDLDEEIQSICEQVDRVRSITSSLLQYSRNGATQDALSFQNINDIVKEGITLVKTGSNSNNIHFVTYLSASNSVECNRNQLLQIIVNLIINAVHAMSSKGVVNIFTEDWLTDSQPVGVIINIQDKGCGIAPENLSSIFEPFFTTKDDGTGLGLAVSQNLISNIGGSIKVKSILGSGSTFSIYLKTSADTAPKQDSHL